MNNIYEQAFKTAEKIVLHHLPSFTHHFPYSHSEGNFYRQSDNTEWTTGFWTGVLWLCYEHSHNDRFREAAEIQVKSFLNRIEHRIDTEHHDMGFLFSPSCVSAYKLTGNQTARKAALLAADNLVGRFQSVGRFIQAWGPLGDPKEYRLIIDCLLNLPLLFWATEETKISTYREIALQHIETAMKVIIREDDSTYHTYYFDKNSGEALEGVTRQGYRNGSAWSRGQAWGIYGSAIAYRYTHDERYISTFNRLTRFFLSHLPEDRIPYWDFDFSTGSDEPRDSSASAIAICGMLEMATHVDADRKEELHTEATSLLKVLIDSCAVKDHLQSNGLLLHGTYARKSPYNPCNDRGVDEPNTWGDYYFMEALMRTLNRNWSSYW